MRDAAEPKGTFPESIRKALMQNNTRMNNILIIIILLSLTAVAGYLAYDILSNKSVGASDRYSSNLQGKESIAVVDAWQEKGIKLFAQGKYNESIDCFNKAISENSSDANAWKYKGKALYALGNYESAIECYDQALHLNSSDGEALYNKGRSLLALNRSGEAKDAFAKAEKLGKWPNPMREANSSKTSVKSGSSPVKGGSRIIVNWDLENSEEHSSVDDSSGDSAAIPKASTTTGAVSHVDSTSNKSVISNDNSTYNASINVASANITNNNVNIASINATEISGNVSQNSSAGPTINATEGNGSVKNKAEKAGKVSAARSVRPLKPRTPMRPAKIKSPKKPIVSKAKDLGTPMETPASTSINAGKTSASKTTAEARNPNTVASAAKKPIKAPKKPAVPKASAAKPRAAKSPIKK